MKYYLQTAEEPTGPHVATVVERMIERGEIDSLTPACEEGAEEWGTVGDYWQAIHAEAGAGRRVSAVPKVHVVSSAASAAAAGPVVYGPLPVWRIVAGVLFFLGAAGAFWWAAALLPTALAGPWFWLAALGGVLDAVIGLALTRRRAK